MSFPQKAPEGSILRSENVIDFLERVRRFNKEWVAPGHIEGDNMHNVSCTVSVKENEWEAVGSWMWDFRNDYTGISVLPYDGGTYVQAPFEDCTEEQFNEMISHLHAIDLTKVIEHDVTINHSRDSVACSGGACETGI
jgi:ribonucleoside-diphosphate reductase alpha chain